MSHHHPYLSLQRNSQGHVDSYIAHDSATDDYTYNKWDHFDHPPKYRKKDTTLVANSGESTLSSTKIDMLFSQIPDFEMSPRDTLMRINNEVLANLSPEEQKQFPSINCMMILHKGYLFLWSHDKVVPFNRLTGMDIFGAGRDIAVGAHITLRHLHLHKTVSSSIPTLADDPARYLRLLALLACVGNSSCRSPIWIHHASSSHPYDIHSHCYDDDGIDITDSFMNV